MTFEFEPIGEVRSPFKTKFGIPRQPGLTPSARGVIKLHKSHEFDVAVRGLEGFSHLWVIFVFHRHGGKRWKPQVRAPRLGGVKKVGLFASRSPHRPNPIGMSVVKIEKVDLSPKDGVEILVSGLDLLDGTPVLDIKPYVAYADSIPDASHGWAASPIEKHPVAFSPEVNEKLVKFDEDGNLKALITEILELDPRPASQKTNHSIKDEVTEGERYGIEVMGFDVLYEIRSHGFHVYDLVLMKVKP